MRPVHNVAESSIIEDAFWNIKSRLQVSKCHIGPKQTLLKHNINNAVFLIQIQELSLQNTNFHFILKVGNTDIRLGRLHVMTM